jgi:hypothetical protein
MWRERSEEAADYGIGRPCNTLHLIASNTNHAHDVDVGYE